MAIENLTDRFYLNNAHVQTFTVGDGSDGLQDLTGLHVKWSMSPIDDITGEVDTDTVSLEKTNQTVGDMTDVDLTNGEIQVNIVPADTVDLSAGTFRFQLEVFDSSGDNGVIVSEGILTLLFNITETV